MANWIEEEDPETALKHRESAVRYAPHDDDLRIYLPKLAALQEKQGHGAGAIRIEASLSVIVDGTITANGQNGPQNYSGAGSGGAIYITCGAFGGTGVVSAVGGNGGAGGGGGDHFHTGSVHL